MSLTIGVLLAVAIVLFLAVLLGLARAAGKPHPPLPRGRCCEDDPPAQAEREKARPRDG